ncbi:lanthionine synthetase C family protein [Crossiella sp. NPDC003009]
MNAGEVVAELAERLADPARVRAKADGHWDPASLVEGYAGIAVLHASLPGGHVRAHAHLLAAVGERTGSGRGGLFNGDLALGFAARIAARSATEYRSLRAAVDAHARRALTWHEQRRPFYYDVIGGLTGLGRYLLAAGQTDPLIQVLRRLVALAEPTVAHGRRVPGWWTPRPPTDAGDPAAFPHGHLNLGLAHGIAGPLALLALCTTAGVEAPGQQAAITSLATWLLAHAGQDEHGPFWRHHLTHAETTGERPPRGPARPAWCYGTPGVARSLQLAAQAIGEPVWADRAVAAMRATLARDDWQHLDASVCHGAAGALHLTARIAHDSGDPHLLAALPGLLEQVLAFADPAAPFLFRYPDAALRPTADRAGYLEGAAGIALALATAAGMCSVAGPVPWDAALLLG